MGFLNSLFGSSKNKSDSPSKGAKRGQASDEYNMGVMYEEGNGVPQDYEKAVQLFHKAADEGNAMAQCKLGDVYNTRGDASGVQKDDKESIKWYSKAASQGFAQAQCELGYMYASGRGVEQDYAEAAGWYRKAAEQGYHAAQSSLGFAYQNGEGVAQDFVQAFMWFALASQLDEFKIDNLRDVGVMMDSDERQEAMKLVRKWKPTKQ